MTDSDSTSHPEMSREAAVNVADGVVTAQIMHPSIGADEASTIHLKIHKVLAQVDSLRALVFDLSEVTFMNSMGVGMCIDLRNRAVEQDAKTFIIGLTPELQKLFEAVKVDELFTLVRSRDDVTKSLK